MQLLLLPMQRWPGAKDMLLLMLLLLPMLPERPAVQAKAQDLLLLLLLLLPMLPERPAEANREALGRRRRSCWRAQSRTTPKNDCGISTATR